MIFEDFKHQVLEIRRKNPYIPLSSKEQEEAKNKMEKIISEINELNVRPIILYNYNK